MDRVPVQIRIGRPWMSIPVRIGQNDADPTEPDSDPVADSDPHHIFISSALSSAGEDVISVDPSIYTSGFAEESLSDLENNSHVSSAGLPARNLKEKKISFQLPF